MISRRLLTRIVAERIAAGESREIVMRQLAAYIIQHKLQKQTAMIINDIEAELAKSGAVVARVISASELTVDLRSHLIDYVKSSTAATTVTLEEIVDTSILGGVIVEMPDKTLDASVATKLKRLRTT